MYITIKNNLQSVYSLKKELGKEDINFYFNEKILDDNKTFYEYNIKNNDKIKVIKKINGGLSGGQIFGYVILLLIYVFVLFSGLIPFISFIISNIIVKALIVSVTFLKSLTDPNNWLNSFLGFIINRIIPFIHFIFDFGIISITMFFLTFACTYQLYYSYWESKGNSCQAFTNAKTLSTFMMLFITGMYILANSPFFLEKLTKMVLPSFLAKLIGFLFKGMSFIRGKMITMMPFSGITLLISSLLSQGIAMLGQYSYMVDIGIKEYIQFYNVINSDPTYSFNIKKYGFQTILDLVLRVEEYERGDYTNKRIDEIITRNFDAQGYVTRSIIQSIFYIFSKIIYLFDICDPNDENLNYIQDKIYNTTSIISEINEFINNPNNPALTEEDKKIFAHGKEVIKHLQGLIEKMQENLDDEPTIVQVDCIFRILENGVATAFPIVLLFVIFFLIFMFIPVGF
jgi:hypothetical protein